MTKRKVTVVYGKWGENTDFALEPWHPGDEDESEVLWIEEVDGA